MTTAVDKAKITLPGNNSRTTFHFDFMVPEGASVSVWVSLDGEDETDETANAVIALNKDQKDFSGGTVEYPVSGDTLTADDTIAIKRDSLFTQLVDYEEGGELDMESIEVQLDLASLERQGIKSRIGEVAPPPPLITPPTVSDFLYLDIIRVSRPIYERVGDYSIKLINGAFAVKGTVSLVLTVETSFTYYCGTSLNAETLYYLYIDDGKVVNSGGTQLGSTLLTHSITAPEYSLSKEGFYNGNNKCIFAFSTDSSGKIVPFFHDGGRLVTINVGDVDIGGMRIPPDWEQISLREFVPKIADFALVTLYADKRFDNTANLLYARDPGGSDDGILATTYSIERYSQVKTGIVYSASIGAMCFSVKRSATAGESRVRAYVNGWYLPRGL